MRSLGVTTTISAMESRKRSSAETKVLASILELGYEGVAPSFLGLYHFLRGEGLALRYDGLSLCGGYPSMGRKRLGMILARLKKDFLLDASEEDNGEEYLYLTREGKEVASAYLSKPHKRSKEPRRAPEEFLPLDR